MVISNHDDMRAISEFYGYAYYHVPIDKDNKGEGFAEAERVSDQYNTDMVVLARYTKIVPPALCEEYQYQIINIHHSFLPSFIGAKPYHQAHQRSVKLIGAIRPWCRENTIGQRPARAFRRPSNSSW